MNGFDFAAFKEKEGVRKQDDFDRVEDLKVI